jgi:hypothetical protein
VAILVLGKGLGEEYEAMPCLALYEHQLGQNKTTMPYMEVKSKRQKGKETITFP